MCNGLSSTASAHLKITLFLRFLSQRLSLNPGQQCHSILKKNAFHMLQLWRSWYFHVDLYCPNIIILFWLFRL
ncbi:Os03g0363850 [Oryza sativa Japonica Group]|uniref:Os03g0363850 protein n=1 Tax=Oryza sativa subsp. japonica TaxID=39947 RepID=A0A0N7KHA9_ORYSJ|nr:hypothetical protein EE612_017562 [Oryza sativa]BAS84305.1 Os03g0363850 [Oryza sativa Japonica Group]